MKNQSQTQTKQSPIPSLPQSQIANQKSQIPVPHPNRVRTRLVLQTRPKRLTRLSLVPLLLAAALLTLATAALAQSPDPSTINQNPSNPIDNGVLQPLVDGLLGKYGWLTTILLAVGSLRILFKPIMLAVENTVKNDPAKLEAIQKFEAGPVYKTLATILDVGASIKLPLVKPPGPPSA